MVKAIQARCAMGFRIGIGNKFDVVALGVWMVSLRAEETYWTSLLPEGTSLSSFSVRYLDHWIPITGNDHPEDYLGSTNYNVYQTAQARLLNQ